MSLALPINLSAVSLTAVDSFFSGVVETGDKFWAFWLFMTGINDTGEKMLLPVSLSPAIIVHWCR